MEKKTNKRQTTIISLSDQNQKEINDLKYEKERIIQEYEDKKAGNYVSNGRVQWKCTVFAVVVRHHQGSRILVACV